MDPKDHLASFVFLFFLSLMNRKNVKKIKGSMPGFPVLHRLPKLAQTHVHRVSDAMQPSPPLSSPSPPCPQSFPASGSISMSQFFASGGQSIGV